MAQFMFWFFVVLPCGGGAIWAFTHSRPGLGLVYLLTLLFCFIIKQLDRHRG